MAVGFLEVVFCRVGGLDASAASTVVQDIRYAKAESFARVFQSRASRLWPLFEVLSFPLAFANFVCPIEGRSAFSHNGCTSIKASYAF
jgi:hypothetical protein